MGSTGGRGGGILTDRQTEQARSKRPKIVPLGVAKAIFWSLVVSTICDEESSASLRARFEPIRFRVFIIPKDLDRYIQKSAKEYPGNLNSA